MTADVFPDVANLPLRGPVMLARSAATLDLITGGRVAVGVGTGVFWDGIHALGGPRRTWRRTRSSRTRRRDQSLTPRAIRLHRLSTDRGVSEPTLR